MKPEPQFQPFPLASPPIYARWWTAGAVLLALVGGGGVMLRPFVEPRVAALLGAILLLLWLLLLLGRTLYYRLNRHLAKSYAEEVEQQRQHWWAWHRQHVALVDAVMIGPLGSTFAHWRRVLGGKDAPPVPLQEERGRALRLLQVFSRNVSERERQLAKQLVQTWRLQKGEEPVPQPLRWYWQGSSSAWVAFTEQMALDFPNLSLPLQPESWRGLSSLDSIVTELQSKVDDAWILCAGSQSTEPKAEARCAAGEAAVLWLLGRSGGALFSRGEWLDAGHDEPAALVRRAQQQSGLEEAPAICVNFSPPDELVLDGTPWNLQQHRQDDYFGELGGLQAMVTQTLAASFAQQHGEPCAWMASDPEHTLAFGIVSPDDASN